MYVEGMPIKFGFTYIDEDGNEVVFEPVKQNDGTYLLVGRASANAEDNNGAQD